MKLKNKVRPEHLDRARLEHECMTKMLFLAWRSAKHGHFDAMDSLLNDAAKSRKILDNLITEKESLDLVQEFVTEAAIEEYQKKVISIDRRI